MKSSYRKYFPGIILLITFLLIAVQVRWIVYSIKFQEKVFEKSVTLALNESISNLRADEPLCSTMKECVACDSIKLEEQFTKSGVWTKIHSAIDQELESYGVDLEYELLILENNSEKIKGAASKKKTGQYYARCMGCLLGKVGYQLVVQFPSRTKYLLQKTGLMFSASIALILLLLLSLYYLLRLYKQELRIAEYTKELLNNVSHEFKTPLSSIALASNMIRKRRYANESKLENYAQLISRENKKLQHLVESLLRLEAVERNAFEYSKERLDLELVLKDAFSTFEVILAEKTGHVKTSFRAENKMINGDRLHLTNVFVNLISNAIKYSKDKPEIEVETKNTADRIVVTVKDNGIGIPHKHQKYIFDKYYRVPTGDVHNVKGFGIGLAYVKTIIAAHEGGIEVKSEEGKGATFTLYFNFVKN